MDIESKLLNTPCTGDQARVFAEALAAIRQLRADLADKSKALLLSQSAYCAMAVIANERNRHGSSVDTRIRDAMWLAAELPCNADRPPLELRGAAASLFGTENVSRVLSRTGRFSV